MEREANKELFPTSEQDSLEYKKRGPNTDAKDTAYLSSEKKFDDKVTSIESEISQESDLLPKDSKTKSSFDLENDPDAFFAKLTLQKDIDYSIEQKKF